MLLYDLQWKSFVNTNTTNMWLFGNAMKASDPLQSSWTTALAMWSVID